VREPAGTRLASSNPYLADARTGGDRQAEGKPMLRHARPADRLRPTGTALAAVARDWIVGPLARRKKTLMITGSALALVSVGSASAATPAGGALATTRTAGVRSAVLTAAMHRTGRHPLLTDGLLHPAAPRHTPAHPSAPAPQSAAGSWQQVSADFSGPGAPAAAAQLMPAGTTGAQGSMPISGTQYATATTIVQQVLARKMGVRSAVIAIATAMQESRLQNLSYGTGDSLGLFQQSPSAGWGTPQQILDPAYAANAFLTALQRYQQADPGWASQPLWTSAQAVQASGFPTAYAQWESEAADMVKQIATSLR
jgi:hypothetical protein